eukprot:73145-Lingulodinium_polyedra.AAC.1
MPFLCHCVAMSSPGSHGHGGGGRHSVPERGRVEEALDRTPHGRHLALPGDHRQMGRPVDEER